jgi:ribosomal protein S18 acetylase RimI-like enzyme
MELRRLQPAELAAVHDLLAALVAASQIAEVAVIQGRVVGFVRGITDGLSNGYLSMVVVAPGHRGQGIGRRLVEHAIGTRPQLTWVLRAGREGASAFFARLGFEPSSIAIERRRSL